MLRFVAAVAVVLAVLTAGALIVAAAVSRVAPLAAKLEAWWARRTGASGTAGRPDGQAAGSADGDTGAMLTAMQGDDLAADGGDSGAGGLGGDGGAGDDG